MPVGNIPFPFSIPLRRKDELLTCYLPLLLLTVIFKNDSGIVWKYLHMYGERLRNNFRSF